MNKLLSNIKSKVYRPELDGLRAFAVFAVIINHFDKSILPYGYLGVDIFFVISGYVITSSLANKKNTSFANFISSFYSRRICRILPALIFFLLINSLVICLLDPNPGFSLYTGIYSLFGFSNIYLINNSTDYFASSTDLNVFTHTWSLGVEEQFYFLFPLIIWVTGFASKTIHSSKKLFITLIFLSLVSLIIFIYFYNSNQTFAYFSIFSRFWEIATGALVYILLNTQTKYKRFTERISSNFLMLSILGIICLRIENTFIPTISIVILTSLLISSLRSNEFIYKLLIKKPALHIGLISYSLYLWHWGILSLSRWSIGIYWWTIPIQILMIYLFALFSYKFIESPIRKNSSKISKKRVFILGISSLFISMSYIITLGKPLKRSFYIGKYKNWDVSKSWRNISNSAKGKIKGSTCHADNSFINNDYDYLFTECISKINSGKTIAFAGDSHALSIMNGQDYLFKKDYNIVHFSRNGCLFPVAQNGNLYEICENFARRSEETLLEKLNEGDFVVIINYFISHLGDKDLEDARHHLLNSSGRIEKNDSKKREFYLKGLKRFLNKAKQKKINIILIGSGIRNLKINDFRNRFKNVSNSKEFFEIEKDHAKLINNYFDFELKNIDGITFIDPQKVLNSCCNNMESYTRYYRDSDHYSDYSANLLMKKVYEIVKEIN